MNDLTFLRGLSFIDSFFPSGGYAHSFGLEVAVQNGIVKTARDFEQYLINWVTEGVARTDAVGVSLVLQCVRSWDWEKVLKIDRQLHAMKTCREVRQASLQMGREVIRIGAKQLEHPMIKRAHDFVEEGKMSGHHATAMGIVLGVCEWSARSAVTGYLYQNIAAWVSAGLRLLPIGQVEGQQLVHSLLPHAVKAAEEIEGLDLEHMTSWMPLHEIRMMRHPRLEVRLFRS